MSIVAIEESVLMSIIARIDELERIVYSVNESASYMDMEHKKEGCEILKWVRDKKPVFTVNELNTGNRRVKNANHARAMITEWLEQGVITEISSGVYEVRPEHKEVIPVEDIKIMILRCAKNNLPPSVLKQRVVKCNKSLKNSGDFLNRYDDAIKQLISDGMLIYTEQGKKKRISPSPEHKAQ